jgi:hypothetical protein
MDRKKTGTRPDRTVLGPDQRSRLHHFWSGAGCGPLFSQHLFQPHDNRLRPVDIGDRFYILGDSDKNNNTFYIQLQYSSPQ